VEKQRAKLHSGRCKIVIKELRRTRKNDSRKKRNNQEFFSTQTLHELKFTGLIAPLTTTNCWSLERRETANNEEQYQWDYEMTGLGQKGTADGYREN